MPVIKSKFLRFTAWVVGLFGGGVIGTVRTSHANWVANCVNYRNAWVHHCCPDTMPYQPAHVCSNSGLLSQCSQVWHEIEYILVGSTGDSCPSGTWPMSCTDYDVAVAIGCANPHPLVGGNTVACHQIITGTGLFVDGGHYSLIFCTDPVSSCADTASGANCRFNHCFSGLCTLCPGMWVNSGIFSTNVISATGTGYIFYDGFTVINQNPEFGIIGCTVSGVTDSFTDNIGTFTVPGGTCAHGG